MLLREMETGHLKVQRKDSRVTDPRREHNLLQLACLLPRTLPNLRFLPRYKQPAASTRRSPCENGNRNAARHTEHIPTYARPFEPGFLKVQPDGRHGR